MQNIVLAIVITVSIWAHVWLYLWMKFKMDEGAITRCLKDAESNLTGQEISDLINMNIDRVRKVCVKSKEVDQGADETYFNI